MLEMWWSALQRSLVKTHSAPEFPFCGRVTGCSGMFSTSCGSACVIPTQQQSMSSCQVQSWSLVRRTGRFCAIMKPVCVMGHTACCWIMNV